MYRIAICEDEPFFLESNMALTRDILNEEGLKEGEDFAIEVFDDLHLLLQKISLAPDAFQLLLLDIIMGDRNGVDIGTLLRKKQVKCGIIYITSHSEYVFQSFDTRPLQYLLKPIEPLKLKAAILENYQEQRGERALLYLDGAPLPIPVEDIFYLESIRHKVEVHLKDRVISGNGPISALEQKLSPKYFCRCHVGYVVNFVHVFNITRDSITLDDGRKVPVSRRLYQQTAQRYITYLKE